MPTDPTCDATLHDAEVEMRCELPRSHTEPTDELPQGTPHQDSDHPDVLTDEPWRWWG